MGRTLTRWGGLLIGLGLALGSAQAGDRKSSDHSHKAVGEIMMARETRAVFQQRDVFNPSAVRSFEVSRSPSADRASRGDEEKENGATLGAPRKPITLLNIKSALGNINLQTSMGPVKGAQLSLAF